MSYNLKVNKLVISVIVSLVIIALLIHSGPICVPLSLTVYTDGGYIIVGGKNLIKLSANGIEEWSKTFDGSSYHSVCQTSDDGYIITSGL